MLFQVATTHDIDRIMQIIRQAQARMKANGQKQWQNGYPATADIERDIARSYGYLLTEEMQTIAYGAIVFDGEPAYEAIDGAWLTDSPYVALHRLAVADEALHRGVATEFMRRTEALARERNIRSFRIDTNFDNNHMLALVKNLGFVFCGEIEYCNGFRLAFEKVLD